MELNTVKADNCIHIAILDETFCLQEAREKFYHSMKVLEAEWKMRQETLKRNEE